MPKFAPHIDAMRQRIAQILDVPVGDVGLKAKTGEGVGPIGSGQAIATRCVVLVYPLTAVTAAVPASDA